MFWKIRWHSLLLNVFIIIWIAGIFAVSSRSMRAEISLQWLCIWCGWVFQNGFDFYVSKCRFLSISHPFLFFFFSSFYSHILFFSIVFCHYFCYLRAYVQFRREKAWEGGEIMLYTVFLLHCWRNLSLTFLPLPAELVRVQTEYIIPFCVFHWC